MPQGWSFFSLPPTDDYFVVLDKDLNIVADWPNASFKNMYGINRAGRSQGIELGTLSYEVGENTKKCEDGLSKCINFKFFTKAFILYPQPLSELIVG